MNHSLTLLFALPAVSALLSRRVVARGSTSEGIYDWADRHNVDRSTVEVKAFSHGGHMIRGLAATRDIRKGEVFLSVPLHLLLSSENPPSSSACKSAWEDQDAYHRLVLLVLLERQKGLSSPWYEYFEALPTVEEYSSFLPYAASKEVRRDFMNLPEMQKQSKWRKESWRLRRDARDVSCFAKEPSDADVLWAESVVGSRSYSSGPTAQQLVPLSDLANFVPTPVPQHANPLFQRFLASMQARLAGNENAGWGQTSTGFAVTATRHIAKGEEIFESYCDATTSGCDGTEILDAWGFLPSDSRLPEGGLSQGSCDNLGSSTSKYYGPEGSCVGPPVACSLRKVAESRCPTAMAKAAAAAAH